MDCSRRFADFSRVFLIFVGLTQGVSRNFLRRFLELSEKVSGYVYGDLAICVGVLSCPWVLYGTYLSTSRTFLRMSCSLSMWLSWGGWYFFGGDFMTPITVFEAWNCCQFFDYKNQSLRIFENFSECQTPTPTPTTMRSALVVFLLLQHLWLLVLVMNLEWWVLKTELYTHNFDNNNNKNLYAFFTDFTFITFSDTSSSFSSFSLTYLTNTSTSCGEYTTIITTLQCVFTSL